MLERLLAKFLTSLVYAVYGALMGFIKAWSIGFFDGIGDPEEQVISLVGGAEISAGEAGQQIISTMTMAVSMFVGSLIVGLLIGLIPYFQAKKRRQKNIKFISIICCALGGLYGGIFPAILICIVFVIIIRVIYSRNKKQA